MKFSLFIDKAAEEAVTVTAHERSELTDKLEELVLSYTGKDSVTAYGQGTLLQLSFSRIECITVQDGKTYAIDETGTQYRLKKRLYEIEAQLPASFIRINKSALANEARLERFVATYSGGVNARFMSGWEEYVSRRCFAQIKRRYENK